MNQVTDEWEKEKDWQAEAAKIPLEHLASWLQENNYLVIQPGLWRDNEEALDDVTTANPVYLLSERDYHEDYVQKEDLKIRLSGSIRDLALEEVIRDGWAKHNWRLADKLADVL